MSKNSVEKQKKPIGLIIGLIAGLIVLLVVMVIVFLVFVAIVFGSETRKLNNKLKLGEKYVTEFDYNNAIIAYQEAIKIDPKSEEAYLGLANVYIALGEYENAINVLKEGYIKTNSDLIDEQLNILYEQQRVELSEVGDHSLNEDTVDESLESEIVDNSLGENNSENNVEVPVQENSNNQGNKYDVEVWEDSLVADVQNQICVHYQNLYNPEGNYAIFDEPDFANENAESYTMVLRYQMSDAEAEAIISSGGMPQANTLVTLVYINKKTGEVSDDFGNDIWLLE